MAGGGGSHEESEEDIDHYSVLGLASGDEGLKLTLKQIEKAYRNQSRIRHPDKRPDDPNATADFQRLTSSFEVLRDETRRSVFDARIRARLERIVRDSLLGAKRRKLTSDLEERERAASGEADTVDPGEVRRQKEKKIAAELKRELEELQARKVKKAAEPSGFASSSGNERVVENGGVSIDKERTLKVSWERELGDYSSIKLREIFERFGAVEDIVIRSKGSRKKGSAIVVMSLKDAAVTATQTMNGNLSNPLLVLPLQPSSTLADNDEAINPKLNNLVGAGFQDYEASILKKLEKANALKKSKQ